MLGGDFLHGLRDRTDQIRRAAICGAGEVVDLHDENANLWVNPIIRGGGIKLSRGQIGRKAPDRFQLCGHGLMVETTELSAS